MIHVKEPYDYDKLLSYYLVMSLTNSFHIHIRFLVLGIEKYQR